MPSRNSLKDYRLAIQTLLVVAVLVGIRAVLWALGIEGIQPTALASSIIGGGIFVLALVIAGTLSDYKDAERAPTDLAAGLYAILRESESMNHVWGAPNLPRLPGSSGEPIVGATDSALSTSTPCASRSGIAGDAFGIEALEWARTKTSMATLRDLMSGFGLHPIPTAYLGQITAPTSLIWAAMTARPRSWSRRPPAPDMAGRCTSSPSARRPARVVSRRCSSAATEPAAPRSRRAHRPAEIVASAGR
jgi:hypothetical protein